MLREFLATAVLSRGIYSRRCSGCFTLWGIVLLANEIANDRSGPTHHSTSTYVCIPFIFLLAYNQISRSSWFQQLSAVCWPRCSSAWEAFVWRDCGISSSTEHIVPVHRCLQNGFDILYYHANSSMDGNSVPSTSGFANQDFCYRLRLSSEIRHHVQNLIVIIAVIAQRRCQTL